MKRLWSAFTNNMDRCYYTGAAEVERHHIFGGANRKKSEEYGYVVPLAPHLHPNGARAGKDAKDIDNILKRKAQKHFEAHYGSREDFIQIFGRSYL